MAAEKGKIPPLEEGLLVAMRALDNQVAREMQRSPEQKDEHGVQKWEPYRKRVERVTAFLVQVLGEEAIELDSLLILTQATAKALQIVATDLGEPGLGQLRAGYLRSAMEGVQRDCRETLTVLSSPHELT